MRFLPWQIPAAGLAVDQELDVAVDFVAPELPGLYISYWRMASHSVQKFGQRVWLFSRLVANIVGIMYHCTIMI